MTITWYHRAGSGTSARASQEAVSTAIRAAATGLSARAIASWTMSVFSLQTPRLAHAHRTEVRSVARKQAVPMTLVRGSVGADQQSRRRSCAYTPANALSPELRRELQQHGAQIVCRSA